eukprot:969307_1
MKLILSLAISLLLHVSFCIENEQLLETIHEDFVLTCLSHQHTSDGVIQSMRSVEKIEQNGSTIFKYRFLFVQPDAGRVVLRVKCHGGLILGHVFMNNSDPSPLPFPDHLDFLYESDKSYSDYELMKFQATATTSFALNYGYCEASMFCGQPPEREIRILLMSSWDPKSFRENISELRDELRIGRNPNAFDKKLYKEMNFGMLNAAWHLLSQSTSPDKYEDAAMIIDLLEKEENYVHRSYVCPVRYFFARLARRLGICDCFPEEIKSALIETSTFDNVVRMHLQNNNISPVGDTVLFLLRDIATLKRTRYRDMDGDSYDLILGYAALCTRILQKYVFPNRHFLLDATAVYTVSDDYPIWIMNEQNTSTLWATLAKERIFTKQSLEHLDLSQFNINLDTEIEIIWDCEGRVLAVHSNLTIAELLVSTDGRSFLEKNPNLAKYEEERLRRAKHEPPNKKQEKTDDEEVSYNVAYSFLLRILRIPNHLPIMIRLAKFTPQTLKTTNDFDVKKRR